MWIVPYLEQHGHAGIVFAMHVGDVVQRRLGHDVAVNHQKVALQALREDN